MVCFRLHKDDLLITGTLMREWAEYEDDYIYVKSVLQHIVNFSVCYNTLFIYTLFNFNFCVANGLMLKFTLLY